MHLGSLESTQKSRVARGATLTHLSYSPNFSRTRYTHAKHEQILNFQLKQSLCFWTKGSVYVVISLRKCDRVWLWNYHRFRVLHAVDSLNVKHELRWKKIKPFCIMQTFRNDISWFATWKSCLTFCMNWSKGVVTSLDGINGESIQTFLRE